MKRDDETQTEFTLRMVREDVQRTVLSEISERLERASVALTDLESDASLAHSAERAAHLASKAEGVRLAKSYVDEMLRQMTQ